MMGSNQWDISQWSYDQVMRNRALRRLIHDLITEGNGPISLEEKRQEIQYVADEMQSGVVLETPEEVQGDLASGEDAGELLLEEQTAIAEEEQGAIGDLEL